MKNKHRKYYPISRTILTNSKKPTLIEPENKIQQPRQAIGEEIITISDDIYINENYKINDIVNKGIDINTTSSNKGITIKDSLEQKKLQGYKNQLRELNQMEVDRSFIKITPQPKFNPYKPIGNRQSQKKESKNPVERDNAPRFRVERRSDRNIDGSDNNPSTNDSTSMWA